MLKDNPLCKIELANRAFVVRTWAGLAWTFSLSARSGARRLSPAAHEAT